ncbi:LacI family DNA-binding transcriptional regulator, partial [Phytoactinopolyspora endophytica]|uniref:LacI family DNA-binding transcriptional regulator n=1 Tax=Phytoactinopolyspora endophytica TaxID=1642495 RepID=UPI00197C9E1B
MRDVAKLAGVSHQTVSRVLNKSPQVRAATRERVHAAMRELGYLPNMAARTLATRKSSTIGLMTVDSLLYGPSAMVYGIEEAAREAGHYVSIASAKVSDKATVLASIDRLRAQGVEGILAVAPEFDVEAVLTHVPADVHIVAVGSSEYVGVPSVGVDNVVGGAMATQHLLDLGHRTVHHLAGPDSPGANERIAGWRSALEAAQAPVPDDPLTGAWSADSGYSQGHRLAADPSVTAVF